MKEQPKPPSRRVLIVGGVAGGASCAARLRRLDESCEIVVFERGPHVSFANCGLPYFVGNIIAAEKSLLVASAELFRDRSHGRDVFGRQLRRSHLREGCERGLMTLFGEVEVRRKGYGARGACMYRRDRSTGRT